MKKRIKGILRNAFCSAVTAALCINLMTGTVVAEEYHVGEEADVINVYDDIPAPTDRSAEYYDRQAESVRVFNNLLDGFSNDAVLLERASRSQRDNESQLYPDYYGGAYINDNGDLVVKMVGPSANGRSLLAAYTDESILIEQCSVSYNQILYVLDTLIEHYDYFWSNDIFIDMQYENVYDSTAVIHVVNLDENKERIIREVINEPFMVFIKSEGGIQDLTGGGYLVTNDFLHSMGTIGFAAKRGTTNGFVITGHSGVALDKQVRMGTTVLGVLTHNAYAHNSTADAAFVTAAKNITPTNVLSNNGQIWGASNYIFPVGTTISLLGGVSGLKSGKVLNIDTTTTKDGIAVKKQSTAAFTGQTGDSGSPILYYDGNYGGTKYTVIGIFKGNSENITPTIGVFSKYSEISSKLGVTAITN